MGSLIRIGIICLLLGIASCQSRNEKATTSPEASDKNQNTIDMKDIKPKVTGIGGIFFKTKDPEATRKWYGKHLGLAIDDYGSAFEFRNANKPDEINYLRWGTFADTTDYFDPSEKEFMVNYRVNNLEALVDELRESGITFTDSIQSYEYGKFIHLMDPEGNKIELWEPVDSVFTAMGGPTTK